jgi:multiple sugar transport system permease protein
MAPQDIAQDDTSIKLARNTSTPTSSGADTARRRRVRFARSLVVPGQLISVFILVFPLLVALVMSFTIWSPTRGSLLDASFEGLFNYEELLVYDTRFIEAVARTLAFTVIALSLELALGLGLALIFMRKFRGKSVLFSTLLTPMMVMPVVVGYTFWMLFQSNGPINQVTMMLFGFAPEWFKSAGLAWTAVIITEVWHWTPLFFLIMLSGLNSLPENPIRAAVILGANPRQIFWQVVLPMLKPVIIVALVIRSVEVIKLFDEVFMLTRGGPSTSTETISLYIYKLAFQDFQLAYGAAAAFLVLIGTLVMVHFLLAPVRDQLLGDRH